MKKPLIWGVALLVVIIQIIVAFQQADHSSFNYSIGFFVGKLIIIAIVLLIANYISKKIK